jgi:hypothetical protein
MVWVLKSIAREVAIGEKVRREKAILSSILGNSSSALNISTPAARCAAPLKGECVHTSFRGSSERILPTNRNMKKLSSPKGFGKTDLFTVHEK